MASTLVPTPRCAADVLSLPENRQRNEHIFITSFGANPATGVVVLDGKQGVRMARNHPSHTFGAAFNNSVKVVWGAALVDYYSHPMDGATVAIEHEVSSGGVNIIRLNEQDFDVRSPVAVYSPEEASNLFAADPTRKKLDPPPNTRSNKISIQYRKMFHIPHVAASTLMRYTDGITPCQYFLEVYPTLDTQEKKEEWINVTEYFQVLAMADTTGGTTSVAELLSAPELVRVDNVIGKCINTGLYELLPERREGGTAQGLHNLNATLSGGVDAFTDMKQKQMDHQAAERQRREDEKRRKHSLGYKLDNELVVERLLRLCGVDKEEKLGPFYQKWSKMDGKSLESFRATLQAVVTEIARKMGKQNLAPVITTALATEIMKAQFHKEHLDDVVTGVLCNFLFYGEADSNFTKGQIRLSQSSEMKDVNLTADKAASLMKFRVALPTTEEAHFNVLRMLMVAKALLPPTHKILSYLEDLRMEWDNHFVTIRDCVVAGTGLQESKGIIVLEAFAIKLNRYWERLDEGEVDPVLEPPKEFFRVMEDRGQWCPQLTPNYVSKLCLKDFSGKRKDYWLDNLWEDGSSGVRRGGVAEKGGEEARASPATNGVAPPVHPMGVNPPADIGQPRANTTVKNTAYNDVLFDEFRRRRRDNKEIPIRSFKQQAIAEKPLPPSKFGADSMCLAWHVKGMCNANCRQVADHRPYSASEYGPLVSWCQECYPAGE